MSNVLKVNSRTKVNVQLFNGYGQKNFKIPSPEEVMEKKIQSAFQDGYEKGLRDGKEEVQKAYEEKIASMRTEVEAILNKVDKHLDDLEKVIAKKVFELSTAIAEKIIVREVETKTTIEENVKRALKKLSGAARITVKINPQELDSVKEIIEEENRNSFKRINIEADERIEMGECIVESEIGNVSARFEDQLEEIVNDFEKYFSEIK